jgi:2-oxoglutarate dehydrogenase E2 component (dihydrolipoamide succinyltransferase)
MSVELKVPPVGESITEVQIGQWLKSAGERVEKDEPVVEIETDKVNVELPAPVSGVITRLLKEVGEVAQVGEVIGYLDEGAPAAASAPGKAPSPAKAATPAPAAAPAASASAPAPAPAPPAEPEPKPDAAHPAGTGIKSRATPAARRALVEHGLTPAEVTATGPAGRLLKEDVLRHLEREGSPRPESKPQAAPSEGPPAGARSDREEEVVAMTPMRRRIAERLVQAQQAAALLSSFNEIDMSAVVAIRREVGPAFQEKHGVKLGFMSFFVKAVIEALKLIPQLNAEIRDSNIVYRNYYDIGIAVSTERGLLVPVLRNAEQMSFAEVELAIASFANRARENKIKLEELEGGTFTISNGGVYGSLLSTPIVNPPQSGILGMHAIQERPVALGGQVVILPMMYVALTYDHRIIDGREAVTFLKRVKELIEDPPRLLLEA